MAVENRLEDLLLRWEDLAEAGQEVSAEELCRECPELATDLQRRIDALREMAWLSRVNSRQDLGLLFPPSLNGHGAALVPGAEPVPGYRLEKRLGIGGFGQVFRALGPDGTPVALKIVPATDKAAVECRALEVIKGVRHPHLLAIRQSWQTEDFLVLALELADRTLLDRWHEAREQGLPGLPREELLNYFRQAACGIDFLHEQGIQHRDIKPQNLLLLGETIKVADFGLARVLAHSVAGHTGSLTLAYAAPEYFDGKTTRHSDQYSLAVAYCQMRGGRLPFEGTPAQVVAGHLHREPDLASMPEEEHPAVARALAKQPQERWPACADFVGAVATGWQPEKDRLLKGDYHSSNGKAGHRLRRKLAAVRPLPLAVAVLLVGLVALLLSPFVKRSDLVGFFEPAGHRSHVRQVVVAHIDTPSPRDIAFSNGGMGPVLWDVKTRCLIKRLGGEAGPAVALAHSHQKPLAASGDDHGNLFLWNLATAKEIRHVKAHDDSISSIVFSRDGEKLLTGSCDSTVRLWDVTTGKELQCCRGHNSYVLSVAFDPTGRRALSGGWDGSLILWDLTTGKPIHRFDDHRSQVSSVAITPDGRQALTASYDRTVRLWDLEHYKQLWRLDLDAGHINHAEFWGKDKVLILADRHLVVWNTAENQEVYRSPELPSEANGIALAARDGKTHALIATSWDGIAVCRLSFLP